MSFILMPKTLLDYLPREALGKAFLSKERGYLYLVNGVDKEKGLVYIFYRDKEGFIDTRWVRVGKFRDDPEATQKRYIKMVKDLRKAAHMDQYVRMQGSA